MNAFIVSLNAFIFQVLAGILLLPEHLILKSELFLPLFNQQVKRQEMHGQIDNLVYSPRRLFTSPSGVYKNRRHCPP
jgi:hypothetical protein